MQRHSTYYVYIVQCVNGTYYTGYTSDIAKRIEAHNKGSGAKYLKGKTPVQLVYLKEYGYYKNALKEERRIKTFGRKKKEKLIAGYTKNSGFLIHKN